MDPTTTAERTAVTSPSDLSGEPAEQSAFELFRLPQGRSRLRPIERPVLDGARTGAIVVNGKTAVTYRWGTGERPVLLVHGWESRGSRFAALISELTGLGYSPVTFDAPGHGDATGDSTTLIEYRDIITQLHSEHGPFEAIVSHSLGVTATFLALRYGVRTDRIVAISAIPDFAYLVDRFCTGLGLDAERGDELRGGIESGLFPGEADIWTRFSVFHELERIRVPLLVIHDEDDNMVGPEHSRRLAAAFPGEARLITTRRLGHRRILGDRQVVRHVMDFMKTGAHVAPADIVADVPAHVPAHIPADIPAEVFSP